MSERTPSKRKKVYIIILVLNHNKELLKNRNEICQKKFEKTVLFMLKPYIIIYYDY